MFIMPMPPTSSEMAAMPVRIDDHHVDHVVHRPPAIARMSNGIEIAVLLNGSNRVRLSTRWFLASLASLFVDQNDGSSWRWSWLMAAAGGGVGQEDAVVVACPADRVVC